jgi:hypothetical protein
LSLSLVAVLKRAIAIVVVGVVTVLCRTGPRQRTLVELVDHAVRDGLDPGFLTGRSLDLREPCSRDEIDYLASGIVPIAFTIIVIIATATVTVITSARAPVFAVTLATVTATVSASFEAPRGVTAEEKGLSGGHEQDDRVIAFDEGLDRPGDERAPADRDRLWLVDDDDRSFECGEFPRL